MIFIQQVVCFLSPSLGEGIENTQRVGYKLYQTTNHGRFFLSHVTPLFFVFFLHYTESVAMSLEYATLQVRIKKECYNNTQTNHVRAELFSIAA